MGGAWRRAANEVFSRWVNEIARTAIHGRNTSWTRGLPHGPSSMKWYGGWGAAVFQSRGPGAPEGVPGPDAAVHRAQRQHGVRSRRFPSHPRPLHALLDHMPDGALGRPAADLVAGVPEGPIAHAVLVGGEIALQVLDRLALDRTPLVRTQEPQGRDHLLHPIVPQPVQLLRAPLRGALRLLPVEDAGGRAHMLLRVVPVQDLHSSRKVLGRQIPDPGRAVPEHHYFLAFVDARRLRPRPQPRAQRRRLAPDRHHLARDQLAATATHFDPVPRLVDAPQLPFLPPPLHEA